MMKQTTKLFRGCPYEMENFETCQVCPNYKRCIQRKKERRDARTAKKIEQFFGTMLPNILMVITLVTSIVAIIICITSIKRNATEAENATTDSTEVTIATSYEEETATVPTAENSFVIVDLVAESPTTDSTEKTSFIADVPEKETTTVDEETFAEEQVVEAGVSAEGPSDSYYYNLSKEEKIVIAKVVWAESRGECFRGKVGVAAVLVNRYFYGDDKFNRNSIEAVVTQPHQFASIKDVTLKDLAEVPECMEAVEAVCKGWDPTREVFHEGALYFYAPKRVTGYQAEIREGIEVMVIGNHNFHVNFEKVGE